VTEWQPIRTAPKDESWVLLLFNDEPEPYVRSGFWSAEYSDWYDSEAASHSLTALVDQPTHWMPLPARPNG
jgi:hypothetical protein